MTHLPKPIILIVEDERLIRTLTADVFIDEGFVVLEAEDAAAALLLYGANAEIQVLFTDVNMPGELNGIDLAEHLKALDPDLHVIITSGLPILRPVGHIAAMFIAKPYDTLAVCNAAKVLLAA
jgi:CheY-like chemotaxis protein